VRWRPPREHVARLGRAPARRFAKRFSGLEPEARSRPNRATADRPPARSAWAERHAGPFRVRSASLSETCVYSGIGDSVHHHKSAE
jgi:hypothetical protein